MLRFAFEIDAHDSDIDLLTRERDDSLAASPTTHTVCTASPASET